jgi:hypothetical protein
VTRGAWPYALALALLALLFTWVNRGELLVLHLGAFTWYRAPVAPVILGAFLFGMGAMVLVGAAHERTRR